jgi:hypothetical protein
MNIQIYSRRQVSLKLEQAFGEAMLAIAKGREGHRAKLPKEPDRSANIPISRDRITEVIRVYGPISIRGISDRTRYKHPTVKCVVSTMKAARAVKVISGGRHSRYVLA